MEGSSEDRTKHQEVREKIDRRWKKGRVYYFYSRFLDDVGLKVSNPNILVRAYLDKKGVAIAVWNTSGQPLRCELSLT